MVCACFERIQDSPSDLGDRSVMHTFLLYTGNFLLSSGNFPGFLLLFPVIFRPARIPFGKVFSNLAQPYTKQGGSYPKGFLHHKNAEPEQHRSENSASFLTMITVFLAGRFLTALMASRTASATAAAAAAFSVLFILS